MLIVGAGEMAELSAKHLVSAGVSRVLVTNRTASAAQQLASQFGGEALDFARLATHLAEADIVICSTGANEYLITPAIAREALRNTAQPSGLLHRHLRSAQH